MIRIFSKDRKELTSDIDTWVVEWTTYKEDFFGSVRYPKVKECHQCFTNRDEAKEFADALNAAMKLLGITALPKASIYKQKRNSL